ncbi:MAG: FliH/SctL family protein [Vulcanimicrobiaceae bacterium]
MPETFVTLASQLLLAAEPVDEPRPQAMPEAAPQAAPLCTHDEIEDVLRDARLFRARLREALDRSVESLIVDIAADVLGRELELAPVDIEAIVERALSRFMNEDPIRVRLHPDEAARISAGDVDVVADVALRRGDAVLELRCGELDASLGVRLDAIVRRFG